MINGVSPPPPDLRIKTTNNSLPPGLGRNLRLFAAENHDNSPSSTHYSDCGERFFHCDDSGYCSANSFGSPFGTCNDFLDSDVGSFRSMSFKEDRSLERFEPGYETEGSQLRSSGRSRRNLGVNLQGMDNFTAAQDYLSETQGLGRKFDNGLVSIDKTGECGVSIKGFRQSFETLLQKSQPTTSDSVHEAVQESLENSDVKAIDCLHQRGFQPRGFGSGHDEEANGGSAFEGELPARTFRTSEVSSLSEKLSDLDSQSDFDSMMGDATDDEDVPYLGKNRSLHLATTPNGTAKDNPLLLNSDVAFGAGDWDEFDQEVGGNDLQVTEIEGGIVELETVDVREDIGGVSKLKAEDDRSGSFGGIADKLDYEDALRTRFELTSFCTSSGSGRPDLEEDDNPELSRVKDHFQTVDKSNSGIDNGRNSFPKTNAYAKGDIGLSNELRNSPPHFGFAKEEERNSCLEKTRIQAFYPDGNRDTSILQPSQINLKDIRYENELECLSDTEEMEEKEENCLKCHEPLRQSNSEIGMSLVPLLDAKTTYSPTAAVENTVVKTQRVEGKSENFRPLTSERRDAYFCDANFNKQAKDANDWGKEDLGPDELSRYVEALDVNESYVNTVHDMEEVLLNSGESGGGRFAQLHTKRGLSGHSSGGYRDGALGASTSGVDSAYPHMQYIQKFDWIEVVGAKQRKGASFGERLVGVKEYTVYQISVHSGRNQWEIERRFRDFLGLYRQLKNTFSAQGRGNLPSPWDLVEKDSYKIFGNASPTVVSERSVLIQECLLSLLRAGSPFDSAPPLFWFLLPQRNFLESPANLEGHAPANMQRVSEESSSFQSHEGLSPGSHAGFITNDYKHSDNEETSAFGKTIRLIVQIHPHKSLKQLLEAQHYSCAGCYKHLDIAKSLMEEFVQTLGWGKPRLCEYMGQLFCSSCHSNETAVLPARVLQHWDFTPCPVSQLAKAYLDSIYDQPMLCVSAVNPFIFSRVPVLVHVMEMRKKLSRMLSCIRCPSRASIQRSLGSRRYLLESSDFFALRDLVDLSKGAFAALPSLMEILSKKIYAHITQQCSICREVGELCGAHLKCEKRSSLIFPFQDGEVMRCESCGLVFHLSCFRKSGGCSCSISDHTDDGHATSPLRDELDVKPYIQNDSSDLKVSSNSSLNTQGSTSSKGFFIDLFQKASPGTSIWKSSKKSGVLNMASLSSSLGL